MFGWWAGSDHHESYWKWKVWCLGYVNTTFDMPRLCLLRIRVLKTPVFIRQCNLQTSLKFSNHPWFHPNQSFHIYPNPNPIDRILSCNLRSGCVYLMWSFAKPGVMREESLLPCLIRENKNERRSRTYISFKLYRIIWYCGSALTHCCFSSIGKITPVDQITCQLAWTKSSDLEHVFRRLPVTIATVVDASDVSDVTLLVFALKQFQMPAVTFRLLPYSSSFCVNPQLERLMPRLSLLSRISLTLWPSVSFQRHCDGFWNRSLLICKEDPGLWGDLWFSYYYGTITGYRLHKEEAWFEEVNTLELQ